MTASKTTSRFRSIAARRRRGVAKGWSPYSHWTCTDEENALPACCGAPHVQRGQQGSSVPMINDVIHAGPAMTAAFLASLVEAVEALTIVLAVGTVRGWRSAATGVVVGFAILAAVVVTLGPLLDRVPLGVLQFAI